MYTNQILCKFYRNKFLFVNEIKLLGSQIFLGFLM